MDPAPTTATPVTCACGQPFACGAAAGRCWCFDHPPALPVPADGAHCLCPRCLAARVAAVDGERSANAG